MIIGVILIAVGVIALAQRLGLISGSVWGYTWPLILIILGLHLLWGWRRGGRWRRAGWCGWCLPGYGEEEEKH